MELQGYVDRVYAAIWFKKKIAVLGKRRFRIKATWKNHGFNEISCIFSLFSRTDMRRHWFEVSNRNASKQFRCYELIDNPRSFQQGAPPKRHIVKGMRFEEPSPPKRRTAQRKPRVVEKPEMPPAKEAGYYEFGITDGELFDFAFEQGDWEPTPLQFPEYEYEL